MFGIDLEVSVKFDNAPGVSRTVDSALEKLIYVLSDPDDLSCYASIIIPLDNGHMTAIAATPNIPLEQLDWYRDFRWTSKPPQLEEEGDVMGIAGRCATDLKPIFLADLTDQKHDHRRYYVNFLSDPNPVGSIVSFPAFFYDLETDIRDCFFVVSVTCDQPDRLTEVCLPILRKYVIAVAWAYFKYGHSDKNGEPFDGTVCIPTEEGGYERYDINELEIIVKETMPEIYKPDGNNQPPDRSKAIRKLLANLPAEQQVNLLLQLVDEIKREMTEQQQFNAAIDEIVSEVNEKTTLAKPSKFEQVLDVFRNRLGEVVPIEELAPIYGGKSGSVVRGSVGKKIYELDQRLRERGYRIEHTPSYRCVKCENS